MISADPSLYVAKDVEDDLRLQRGAIVEGYTLSQLQFEDPAIVQPLPVHGKRTLWPTLPIDVN